MNAVLVIYRLLENIDELKCEVSSRNYPLFIKLCTGILHLMFW
jgi:hypothetical protein